MEKQKNLKQERNHPSHSHLAFLRIVSHHEKYQSFQFCEDSGLSYSVTVFPTFRCLCQSQHL